MGGARLLDDIARMLAEPMPRRRAVRVIGASIAALGSSRRVAANRACDDTWHLGYRAIFVPTR